RAQYDEVLTGTVRTQAEIRLHAFCHGFVVAGIEGAADLRAGEGRRPQLDFETGVAIGLRDGIAEQRVREYQLALAPRRGALQIRVFRRRHDTRCTERHLLTRAQSQPFPAALRGVRPDEDTAFDQRHDGVVITPIDIELGAERAHFATAR